MKLKPIFFLIFFSFTTHVYAQNSDSEEISFNVKLSSYFTFNAGWGMSASFGAWQKFKYVQPSTAITFHLVGGRKNMGNKNRYNANWQVNTIFSPTLTFRTGNTNKDLLFYEELHPFYFGGANSIYCNYRNSITVGSSFYTSPKGYGKNINSFRNRSQQLIYLGLRFGGDVANFQFHAYEDFLATDNALLQFLADNFDRYYTGGGNFQIRVNEKLKMSVYSETYTGNFEYDLFDYPDIYNFDSEDSLKNLIISTKKRLSWTRKTVFQEPGQKILNSSRTFLKIDYDNRYQQYSDKIIYKYYALDQISLLVGLNDRRNWQQDKIHDFNKTQKISRYTPYQWNNFEDIKNEKLKLTEKDIINGHYSLLKPNFMKFNEGKHHFEQVNIKRRFFVGGFNSYSNFISKLK